MMINRPVVSIAVQVMLASDESSIPRKFTSETVATNSTTSSAGGNCGSNSPKYPANAWASVAIDTTPEQKTSQPTRMAGSGRRKACWQK